MASTAGRPAVLTEVEVFVVETATPWDIGQARVQPLSFRAYGERVGGRLWWDACGSARCGRAPCWMLGVMTRDALGPGEEAA